MKISALLVSKTHILGYLDELKQTKWSVRVGHQSERSENELAATPTRARQLFVRGRGSPPYVDIIAIPDGEARLAFSLNCT